VIRVHILERNPIFRLGLIDVFSAPGFEVSEATAVSTEAHYWRCDVLVVDPAAIDREPVEEFFVQASAFAPVEMFLDKPNRSQIEHYSECGVAGFLERTANVDTIHEVTRNVVRGDRLVHIAPRDADSAPLSPRERQVLRHVSRGLTHTQIARLLEISQHTVDTYIKRIRAKLALGNKADLTRAAMMRCLFRD